MASLTHVCMWSGNGWKRTTAEQAAKLHPGGTISARSGLFMCELCGQYVVLTDGDIRARYFRHSANEESKDCPERTFGPGCTITYDSREHDLPIRIVRNSVSSFRFEIGLIRAPISSLPPSFRVEIRPKGVFGASCVFARERLRCDGITYLPIGERPFEKYILSYQNGSDELLSFWPTETKGVDPSGTLFEKASGKKLPRDTDVKIKKEYLLLKRGILHKKPGSMRIREIAQKQFGWEAWVLYQVSAPVFDEEAARFYLDFHCRLTDRPVSLQPVWPLFIEEKYALRHNQDTMYMLVEGNAAAVKAFPDAAIRPLYHTSSQSTLYEVPCSGRQQLISAGRTHALQYTYVWKEPLAQAGMIPEVSVTDPAGAEVASGETDTLPPHNTLHIRSAFDGELILLKNNRVAERRKLSADKYIEQDGLSYGSSVQVVIGLDVIWQIDFRKRQPVTTADEIEILKQLTDASGAAIPAPHALRNILAGMSRYPRIGQWIRTCIKEGTINEQAYRRLQKAYLSMNELGDA